MTFSPVVPFGGLLGYRFMERTYSAQLEHFGRSPEVQREIDYFLDHAAGATTAEALVADRRLLRVALGAFGLDDEVDKRAFIRRILEDGTLDPKALANRLADPAWREFALALGYGDLGGTLGIAGTRREIAERFRLRQFERAVGDTDLDIRLALNFRREIAAIAAAPGVEKSGWLKIMGSQPLRRVIETAFGLPQGFGQLDIDRQRHELGDRAQRLFGGDTPAVFAAPENVDRLIRRFLAASQSGVAPGPAGAAATALSLLQGSNLGAGARASLFASNL